MVLYIVQSCSYKLVQNGAVQYENAPNCNYKIEQFTVPKYFTPKLYCSNKNIVAPLCVSFQEVTTSPSRPARADQTEISIEMQFICYLCFLLGLHQTVNSSRTF